MEKSNFDNVRLVESIFIQEPGKFPVEKSYFPVLAVIKLNRLMTTEDNQITINYVLGGLLRNVRNDLYYRQFFESKSCYLLNSLICETANWEI